MKSQLILVENNEKVKKTIMKMFKNSEYSLQVAEDKEEADKLYSKENNGFILNRLNEK